MTEQKVQEATQSKGFDLVEALKRDEQLELAKQAKNTWNFKGEEKELWLINSQSGAGVGIIDPETKNVLGILSAIFAWEDSTPFMEFLDFGWKDVTNLSTDETTEQMDNKVVRNCKLFRTILQSGSVQEINEIGEKLEATNYTPNEFLEIIDQEYQSALIDQWLNSFIITRHFDSGEGRLKNILKADTLKFKIAVGEPDKPRHIAIVEFNKPSYDARRDYEDKASSLVKEQQGTQVTKTIAINNPYKMRFAKKLFSNVQGVSLVEIGKPFTGTPEEVQLFKQHLLPILWVRLADAIMNAFQNTGKH